MKKTLLSLCLAVALVPGLASAQAVPQLFNHEGLLLDAQGLPLEGNVSLRLAVYDRANGGAPLWFEELQVELIDGYYTLRLGGQRELGGLFQGGGERYLGISVNGDAELFPRHPITSVPYALVAADVIGDIHPRSLSISGREIIDASGNWVGPPVPGAGDGVGYDTPEAVLGALRSVDGEGSGLDADRLDGRDSSEFLSSPEQVLEGLKQVDGEGSGLDADRLDGMDSSEFVSSADQVLDHLLTVHGSGSGLDADQLDGLDSTDLLVLIDPAAPQILLDLLHEADGEGSGLDADLLDGLDSAEFFRPGAPGAADTLAALMVQVDGAGSGLDADRLDGVDSSQFMRADQDTGTVGALSVEGELSAQAALRVSGALDAAGGAAIGGTLQTEEVRVAPGARVGVGVADPQAEVHVDGDIIARNLFAETCQADSIVLPPLGAPPADPAPGTLYYDRDAGSLRFWDGSEWGAVGSGGGDPGGGGSFHRSCWEILDAGESRGDGLYTIDPTGGDDGDAFQVYCDMSTDGGGWTLVLLSNRGVGGCPTPNWNQAVGEVNTHGGELSADLSSFDLFLGVRYWNTLGTKLRAETGASRHSLAHRAYYDFYMNEGNNYQLALTNEQVTIHTEGNSSSGLFLSHNNRSLSTHDADHDTSGGSSCSRTYCNAPWWYESCWSGNFWGGCGCNHTDDAYWHSSDTSRDHYAWGGIWLGGPGRSRPDTLRRSCFDILREGESVGDGIYTVDPDGEGGAIPFEVYCDMSTDGGGWTLVLLSNRRVSSCPKPDWNAAVNSVTYNGSALSIDLMGFDMWMGVKYWRAFGTELRLETGANPSSLSHRAYYDFSLDEEEDYRLSLSNERITIHTEGNAQPGLLTSHNGQRLSTRDRDNDSHGGSHCSANYCNAPWWYSSCWSGNFWGGCGCNHTDDPYWYSSDTSQDHFAWGAFWLRGFSDDGVLRASCKAILDDGASRGDGVYSIDPNGGDPGDAVDTYCDMSTDGGGWTLVASNAGADQTFPRGTDKVAFYLDRGGFNDDPAPNRDYLIGPQIADLSFTEARVRADRSGDGAHVTDLKWDQDCYRCFLQNNGVGSGVTLLPGHNVLNIGCGSANHCNVDGQWADTFDSAWDSNYNQRTIGGVCTRTCPDPSCGTYVGHGHTENNHWGEGSYYDMGSCSHQDDSIYTTWVR